MECGGGALDFSKVWRAGAGRRFVSFNLALISCFAVWTLAQAQELGLTLQGLSLE